MSSTRDESGGAPSGKPAAQAARATSKSTTGKGSPGTWLSKAAGKVPTKWLTAAVVGLFLAATAAFGGLEPVEATEPTALHAGETHTGPMVTLTLKRAVLIDSFTEGGSSANTDTGERVLVVVADVENISSRPVNTLTPTFGQVLRLEALPDLPLTGAARLDDATIGAVLQPGVPAELVLSWVVPADAFAEGDEVRIALFDHELRVGQSVMFGEYWANDPELAAVVMLEADDVGAGANAETDPEELP